MLKNFFLLLVTLSVLPACAYELPGAEAFEVTATNPKVEAADVGISIEEIDSLSSSYYRAYNVSFKNRTDRWIRIESTGLKFPTLTSSPEILLATDLNSYVQAITRRNSIDAHNRAVALSTVYAVALVGGAAGAHNNNAGVAGAGFLGSLGAISVAAAEGIAKSRDGAQFANALPDGHLLKPFDIPPGLSIARWIILKIDEEIDVNAVSISLKEKDHVERTFKVEELHPVQERRLIKRTR
ncbi:MAG: hypothetical protein EOP10_18155 [Proteobacteria bacterium]|nr:MAG: hypothetical protein EOP10_18155 [Pseudomonadota bacterium]